MKRETAQESPDASLTLEFFSSPGSSSWLRCAFWATLLCLTLSKVSYRGKENRHKCFKVVMITYDLSICKAPLNDDDE